MRIFFIGEGRLGNQVFQYTALSSIAPPGSHITAVGLEELEGMFELRGPSVHVIRGGLWFKRFAKYVVGALLLRPLSRYLRLFGYATEARQVGPHAGHNGRLELRRGLLAGIVFADGGYYQNSDFWHEMFPSRWLVLRETWRTKARDVVAARAGFVPVKPFFLHVRRGDYASYRTHGVGDLLLPTEYFRRAIDAFRARGDFDLLILVTDDADWARREFAGVGNSILLSEDPRTDFAVMANCAGGIVSNSTFSLSAALFIRAPELVIAPEYWFGFRVGQWLPPGIRFDHPRISYLPVLRAAA